jgi:hypothetical protein
MAEKAATLDTEKKKKFAQQYQRIIETERKLGIEVDNKMLVGKGSQACPVFSPDE